MFQKNNRVIVYIDGFNLYFGMKSKGWRRYYWLNVQSLANNLLRSDQVLIKVKYFTSRVFSSDQGQSKVEDKMNILKLWKLLQKPNCSMDII